MKFGEGFPQNEHERKPGFDEGEEVENLNDFGYLFSKIHELREKLDQAMGSDARDEIAREIEKYQRLLAEKDEKVSRGIKFPNNDRAYEIPDDKDDKKAA